MSYFASLTSAVSGWHYLPHLFMSSKTMHLGSRLSGLSRAPFEQTARLVCQYK